MHPFSTPLKHQKTVWFSDVFRGLKKGALETNGLTNSSTTFLNSFNFCFENLTFPVKPEFL